ncbi:hypothetical protein BC826DRAFT_1002497, partial [Russula brevipes]
MCVPFQLSVVPDSLTTPAVFRLRKRIPVTPYGRDVLYTLGSPVGYSDHFLEEMSIFMATYLVRYKILRCTVPESF